MVHFLKLYVLYAFNQLNLSNTTVWGVNEAKTILKLWFALSVRVGTRVFWAWFIFGVFFMFKSFPWYLICCPFDKKFIQCKMDMSFVIFSHFFLKIYEYKWIIMNVLEWYLIIFQWKSLESLSFNSRIVRSKQTRTESTHLLLLFSLKFQFRKGGDVATLHSFTLHITVKYRSNYTLVCNVRM